MAAILNFEKKRQKLEQDAYDWAASELKRLGIPVKRYQLALGENDDGSDLDGCVRSIFFDKATGKTLLRFDWPKEGAIKYDVITNLPELWMRERNKVKRLVENGVRVYRFFDGKNGGVTRLTHKAFPFN